jgi:hypothetical protein
MALQSITNINIDFYDKKYILINAKQLDKKSRFISIACYNHGEPYSINSGEHAAYIRYRKSDNNSVFNFCEIDRKGNILVELTEQMLVVDGICQADLVIVNKGEANVNASTGEITAIDNASVLSTMPLYIDVVGNAVANSDIESSYEYDGLNDLLIRAEADYKEVVLTSKSWAIGDTGIRNNENTDNAKYYSTQSSNSANASKISETNAKSSENLTRQYMNDSLSYKNDAYSYMESADNSARDADASAESAASSEESARSSEINAASSEENAKASETSAKASETSAKTSETNAKASETNAKTSETNALNSANKAQSYAVGGTGTRENEDYDNTKYYYELMKNIVIGLDSGFIPMGTISFSELSKVEKLTGYVYNIRDNFVTDNTFREGEGRPYAAGTNVYYTAEGHWDCFGGESYPTASIDEVKEYLGI